MMSVNAFATLLEAFLKIFFADPDTDTHTHTHTHTGTKALIYPCYACTHELKILTYLL